MAHEYLYLFSTHMTSSTLHEPFTQSALGFRGLNKLAAMIGDTLQQGVKTSFSTPYALYKSYPSVKEFLQQDVVAKRTLDKSTLLYESMQSALTPSEKHVFEVLLLQTLWHLDLQQDAFESRKHFGYTQAFLENTATFIEQSAPICAFASDTLASRVDASSDPKLSHAFSFLYGLRPKKISQSLLPDSLQEHKNTSLEESPFLSRIAVLGDSPFSSKEDVFSKTMQWAAAQSLNTPLDEHTLAHLIALTPIGYYLTLLQKQRPAAFSQTWSLPISKPPEKHFEKTFSATWGTPLDAPSLVGNTLNLNLAKVFEILELPGISCFLQQTYNMPQMSAKEAFSYAFAHEHTQYTLAWEPFSSQHTTDLWVKQIESLFIEVDAHSPAVPAATQLLESFKERTAASTGKEPPPESQKTDKEKLPLSLTHHLHLKLTVDPTVMLQKTENKHKTRTFSQIFFPYGVQYFIDTESAQTHFPQLSTLYSLVQDPHLQIPCSKGALQKTLTETIAHVQEKYNNFLFMHNIQSTKAPDLLDDLFSSVPTASDKKNKSPATWDSVDYELFNSTHFFVQMARTFESLGMPSAHSSTLMQRLAPPLQAFAQKIYLQEAVSTTKATSKNNARL